LEAMAARVPVISSDVGGIPEVNIDGETGFVLPMGDVKAMAEKSIQLLKNNSLLMQFKDNAKKQAERFDKKNILPMYEDLYLSVLEKVK